jgi:myosin heavy subunit
MPLKSVWYANPVAGTGEPFLPGRCAAVLDGAEGDAMLVELAAGGEPLELRACDVFARSEAEQAGGVPDAAGLFHLNEPSMLQNVARRYEQDDIYSYVGPVLLAVNPYKTIPELYSDQKMEAYRGRALGVMPPHVFALADRARRMILSERRNQSVVVSGESGAGKTESCRAIVNYLAHHSRHEADGLCTAMLSASPLLEAFGCASTLRNKNSSRFGKLMQIWASGSGGAATFSHSSIETYLLEKGRVSHHAAGERTFHVLYYVAAAAARRPAAALNWSPLAALSDAAQGGGATAFRLLSQERAGGSDECGEAAAEEFVRVTSALAALGATAAEIQSVGQILAAVLLLGNVTFRADGDDKAVVDDSRGAWLGAAAPLLGVDAASLGLRLTSRTVHSGRGSTYAIRYTVAHAEGARDGLVRELYSRLFAWLVARVNASLAPTAAAPEAAADGAAPSNYIAILDIFGFESLAYNSLEQLLINHANETLQQFFMERTMRAEIAMYAEEGVRVPPIRVPDNGLCVELVHRRPDGIAWLIEDEGSMPKPSDESLISRIYSTHAEHASLAPPGGGGKAPGSRRATRGLGGGGTRFVVAHFAAEVRVMGAWDPLKVARLGKVFAIVWKLHTSTTPRGALQPRVCACPRLL